MDKRDLEIGIEAALDTGGYKNMLPKVTFIDNTVLIKLFLKEGTYKDVILFATNQTEILEMDNVKFSEIIIWTAQTLLDIINERENIKMNSICRDLEISIEASLDIGGYSHILPKVTYEGEIVLIELFLREGTPEDCIQIITDKTKLESIEDGVLFKVILWKAKELQESIDKKERI